MRQIKKSVQILLLWSVLLFQLPVFSADSPLDIARMDLALESMKQGRYKEAADIWAKMSNEGHMQAQFSLASSYEYGLGREKNMDIATDIYLKAANQGHAHAMYRLGMIYLSSHEETDGIKLAIDWWQKAAEQEFVLAQFHLGVAYYIGLGVEQNEIKGLAMLEKAQANGYKQSEEVVSMIRIKQNAPKSNDKLTLASEAKFPKNTSEQDQNEQSLPVTDAMHESELSGSNVSPGLENHELTKNTSQSVDAQMSIPVYASRDSGLEPFTHINDAWMVDVVEDHGAWLKIRNNNQFIAWVFGKFISNNNEVSVVTSDNLRIRSLPSTESESVTLGLLNEGDTVVVLETSGEWEKIIAPVETIAWIRSSDYLPDDEGAAKTVVKLNIETESDLEKSNNDATSEKTDDVLSKSAQPINDKHISQGVSNEGRAIRPIPVYAAPNLDLTPFSTFKGPDVIDVIEDQGAWLKVKSNNFLIAWVSAQFVKTENESTVISGAGVRIRPLPSTGPESPPIGALNNGERVVVIESKGDWKRILAPLSTLVWVRASDYAL